ncbi:hypothetical protein MKX01_003609 [Papaver californicum]|nr:hypothetical protein MKX01_003609 [Papaver californicum]
MGEKPEKNQNEGEKKGEEEKKKGENGVVPIVLMIDMHCDGCAKKVIRSIKRFEGVEKCSADSTSNKITVIGKVDPVKLRENVESKTKKKVELLSPIPKKDDKNGGGGDKKKPEEAKKPEEKKPKEPQVVTVVLKTSLHCDGCVKKLKKMLKKYKGVDSSTIDSQKDLVTVKGTMDAKVLTAYLKEKLKRPVDVFPPKKDDGKGKDGGDKKEKGGDDGGEKKGEGGASKNVGEQKKVTFDISKVEHYPFGYAYAYPGAAAGPSQIAEGYSYGNAYGNGFGSVYANGSGFGNGYANGGGGGAGNGYVVDHLHPPQMFSDENPNSCSIM